MLLIRLAVAFLIFYAIFAAVRSILRNRSLKSSRLDAELRGEEMVLHMEGPPMPGKAPEKLLTYAESILPEAACTSVQLHLQV